MPKRRRKNKGLRWALIVIAIGFVFFMIVMPNLQIFIEKIFPDELRKPLRMPGLIYQLQYRIMEALTAIWFFTFGAVIASFMNVVAWRLPNGRTLLNSSQCPYCCNRIRLSDNIPIFGWILLKGRCRKCQLQISSRYPIVELLLGMAFLVIFQIEVVTGAANVPFSTVHYRTGMEWIVWDTKWEVMRFYILHCTLFTVLFTWTLMKIDRFKIPIVTYAIALGIGIGMPLIWEHLQTVPWILPRPAWLVDQGQFGSTLDTSLVGLLVGLFLGLIGNFVSPSMQNRSGTKVDSGIVYGMILVGVFLGWQSAISAFVIFSALSLLAAIISKLASKIKQIPILAYLSLAALFQICFWKTFTMAKVWPNYDVSILVAIAWVAGSSFTLFVARVMMPNIELPPIRERDSGENFIDISRLPENFFKRFEPTYEEISEIVVEPDSPENSQ